MATSNAAGKRQSTRRKTHRAAGSAELPVAAAPTIQPRVTIRHYCQGLGDCHLLTFPKSDGTAFRMLIDCGLHSIVTGGTKIVDAIAEDIRNTLDGAPIDVLIVTHEHWDHVSGFWTARDIFKNIKFSDVWMAWTENPDDPLAREFDRYRGQALAALQIVGNRLAASPGLTPHLERLRDGISSLTGFLYGAAGDKVRTARNAAAATIAPKSPTYLEPGGLPITIPGLPDLRIFVLGPPRDRAMLRLEERSDEMYHFGGRAGWGFERALSASFALGDEDADWAIEANPFGDNDGHDLDNVLAGKGDAGIRQFISDHYAGNVPPEGAGADHLADQSWRRIDADWMGIAADLAMQLDRGINNTSLVLAFEFTDTGRVCLFPGDAQIGSWLSWEKQTWADTGVTSDDLLARTVYLKVAHHGSHNATPERNGLEKMVHVDLSAFVPINEADAQKARWHQMPFGSILTALATKASGRVMRADDAWVEAGDAPPFAAPSGSILAVRNKGEGWIEVDVT